MKNHYIIKYTILLCITMQLFACEKQLEVKKSANLILDQDVFANTQTATSSLLGLYGRLMSASMHFTNGGLTIYPALSADEIKNLNTNENYDVFFSNAIPSGIGIINLNLWSSAYRTIYHTNALIKGVEASVAIPEVNKKQLIGEALFVRGFCYFYLVNFFGDVPLILSTNYEENLKARRAPVSLLYSQILLDLEKAEELLAEDYPSANKVRVNKVAASAFLARVNLYLGKWDKADFYSSKVIASQRYNLETDVDKVFLNNSGETIWQLMREANNTVEATLFIPASATTIPTFNVTDALLNSFENNDFRKSKWIASRQLSGKEYRYPFKYKQRTNAVVNENLVVFRLAEQYLIRAEARINTDRIALGIEDLNKLRQRSFSLGSNYQLPNTVNKEAALSLLIAERQRELFCEWGHRWLDLKRLNITAQELKATKSNFQSFALLYPIPSAELLINVYLTQNAGYVY